MSKPALEELKKRFQEQKEKKDTQGTGTPRNNDFYPFWSINDDEIAIVRSLPIANQKGALPFIEKDHHKISINGKDETIPCEAMYGNPCPICDQSREYYKLAEKAKKAGDAGKQEEFSKLGKYYYRSRSYLGSVLVKKDPLPADAQSGENHEGKVRVIQFGNQLYKKYNTSLETLATTNELDDVPWDLENGLDFNIVKKNGGQFAKWDLASDFARRSTSLPADFIETFVPVDLTKYLPTSLGVEKVQRMLEAHMTNGEVAADPEGTAHSHEPIEAQHTPVVETKVEAKVEVKTEKPAEVITKKVESAAPQGDDDIDAMLRQLRTKTAAE